MDTKVVKPNEKILKPGMEYIKNQQQQQFAAYLNFHQKIWKPDPRENQGRTFFTYFMISKIDFDKAKVKITSNGAQNLINKLEGGSGVSLRQAFRDGAEELIIQSAN